MIVVASFTASRPHGFYVKKMGYFFREETHREHKDRLFVRFRKKNFIFSKINAAWSFLFLLIFLLREKKNKLEGPGEISRRKEFEGKLPLRRDGKGMVISSG